MATASRPPETDIARVRRYCQRHVPPHARDQVRLETVVRGSAITIIERRAPWRDDFGPEWSRLKVAQLRYDHGAWTGTVASGRPTACRRRTIRPGSDRECQFVERDRQPPVRRLLYREFVMRTSQILHQAMSGDHGPGAAIPLESSHRTQPRLEAAVVGLDVIVGIAVGAVQAAGRTSWNGWVHRRMVVTTSTG